MNNISVTDNRTITVIINGTEHKLAIKEAEVLRDALVKALPTAVPRPECNDLAELLKNAKSEHINAPSWIPANPFPPTPMPFRKPPEIWCTITDAQGHRVFL